MPAVSKPLNSTTTSTQPHLVIACGGTGGHFYPTLAIAEAFRAKYGTVTLLLAGTHAAEQLKIANGRGIDAVPVPAVRGPSSPLNAIAFPFRMLHCILAARREIKRLKPDVMLGMGSYASVPACLAKPAHIPLVLHEGNAFMGKANRLFAGRASAIGLSLPLHDTRQLKGCRSEIVGMPLRETLVNAAPLPTPAGFLQSLGLSTDHRHTILVFGGSQGARRINELFTEAAPALQKLATQIQFIFLTGTDDNDALSSAYKNAGLHASIRRADPNIEHCYQAASLVFCRGGASTLCELALFAKPAVIIPLPTAADDHQSVNANLAQSLGGAIHLPQSSVTPQKVTECIQNLLDNPDVFAAMGSKLNSLAHKDAAQRMADLIHSVL